MVTGTTASRPAAAPARVPGLTGLPQDGTHHFRGDIEGLRAVAVLLVIGDHLLGWPHGGFVGVDVFFVISGFLITGLLLREHRTRGRISFVDFYRRRIRRILPAAVLVLAVTVVAANVVFFAGRARDTLDDAWWSFGFAANWRFALEGTDYQQAAGPVSPLQHFWSLSVEEQFYVVWPALMALVLAFAGWRRRHRRKGLKAITATVLLVVAGSLAWALHETAQAPNWAYFSTFSRAWELGIGALIAIATPALLRLPARVRPLLGWAGVAGIGLSAVLIDGGTPFPAPGAALPVLSAAAIIAAGTGGTAHLLPLDNRPARYLGALSYSLYLWHFPVVVLLAALLPVDARYYAIAAGITLVASMASYHLVEQPIRRSNWLLPAAEKAPRTGRLRVVRWATVAAAGALTAVLVVGQTAGWPWDRDADAQTAPPVAAVDVPAAEPGEPVAAAPDPAAVLSQEIAASLTVSEWPELTPGLDQLGEAALVPEWTQDDCLNIDTLEAVPRCRYGDPDAPRTAVLLGDSVGFSWMPGLRGGLEGAGYQIQSLTMGQCPQVPVEVEPATDIAGFAEICRNHQAWVFERVRTIQPDLVVVGSAGHAPALLASGATGQAALEEWRDGVGEMLTELDTVATRVVVLGAPPEVADLQECATRFNSPQDCITPRSDDHRAVIAVEQEVVEQFQAAAITVTYVDTTAWFCDAAGRCPSFVGTAPVSADGKHLTGAYSARLAPVLAPVLIG